MQGAITAHTSVCVCPLPPETRKYYKVSSPYARKGKLATSRSCIILIALKYHTRPVNIPVLLQRLILLFAFTLVDYISLKLEGSCCTPTQNLIIFGYPPGNPDACLPGTSRRRRGVAIIPPDSWASICRHHVRREATSGIEEDMQPHPRAGPRGTASLKLLSMYTNPHRRAHRCIFGVPAPDIRWAAAGSSRQMLPCLCYLFKFRAAGCLRSGSAVTQCTPPCNLLEDVGQLGQKRKKERSVEHSTQVHDPRKWE